MSRHHQEAQLTAENGSLVLQCGYDAGLVAAIKSQIPANERKFDPTRKAWIVAAQHGDLVAKMVTLYLGEMVYVPKVWASSQPEIKVLTLHYIGQTKPRQGYDERTALGLDAAGTWSAVFPENVLRTWFMGIANANSAITLYGVLGVTRSATEDEIKAAFRRLARQWHPDVCSEPDAKERFIEIKKAFDLLSDPNKRARYEVGLALEESLGRNSEISYSTDGFKPLLRCGHILAEGIDKVGRFNVTKILSWEDITDPQGRILVTSWPLGAKEPVLRWA